MVKTYPEGKDVDTKTTTTTKQTTTRQPTTDRRLDVWELWSLVRHLQERVSVLELDHEMDALLRQTYA